MTDIYAGSFDTEGLLLKVKALDHMKKVLLREGKCYQNVLHKRCGAGLTARQFEVLVQILVDHGFICTTGERGAITIALGDGACRTTELLTEPDQHNEQH